MRGYNVGFLFLGLGGLGLIGFALYSVYAMFAFGTPFEIAYSILAILVVLRGIQWMLRKQDERGPLPWRLLDKDTRSNLEIAGWSRQSWERHYAEWVEAHRPVVQTPHVDPPVRPRIQRTPIVLRYADGTPYSGSR